MSSFSNAINFFKDFFKQNKLWSSVICFLFLFFVTNILFPIGSNFCSIVFDSKSWEDLFDFKTNFAHHFVACLILFFLTELYAIREDTENKVKSSLTKALSKADIVLTFKIESFDPIHVKVMQDIIKGIEIKEKETGKNVKAIYALDASPYQLWWSGSTLGYFAIQSKWVSNAEGKKVHRFFVLDETSLSVSQARKFLQLHILMGIETYIIFQNNYDDLCKEFRKIDAIKNDIEKKEFLVWDEPETITVVENETGKNLGPLHGYQSLWFVDTPDDERMITEFLDIGGNRTKKAVEWTVRFEFIPSKYKHKALNYLNFANFLIDQAKTCQDDNAVEDYKNGYLRILHLPLEFQDKRGEHKFLDITTMDGIFRKYIECHNTKSK